MDHLAILRKSWKLKNKILRGEKTIESRWYSARCAPWDRISAGETIYFKDSGEPVSLKAEVERVEQISNLTEAKVKEILNDYWQGIGLDRKNLPEFVERFKAKRYVILVFLKNPQMISPFEIDKRGFGLMSAWITVDSIKGLKKSNIK